MDVRPLSDHDAEGGTEPDPGPQREEVPARDRVGPGPGTGGAPRRRRRPLSAAPRRLIAVRLGAAAGEARQEAVYLTRHRVRPGSALGLCHGGSEELMPALAERRIGHATSEADP